MKPRRRFSAAQIQLVWERQGGKCACECGEPLIVGQFDKEHAIPLWQGMTDEERARLDTLDNLQLMLKGHHKIKTAKESTMRAKEERMRRKHNGTWLKPRERELAARLSKTKQIGDRT